MWENKTLKLLEENTENVYNCRVRKYNLTSTVQTKNIDKFDFHKTLHAVNKKEKPYTRKSYLQHRY